MGRKFLTWITLTAMLAQSVAPVIPTYAEAGTYDDISANDILTDNIPDITANDISTNDISANEIVFSKEDSAENISDNVKEDSHLEEQNDISENNEEEKDLIFYVVSDDITSNDATEESEENITDEEELSDAFGEFTECPVLGLNLYRNKLSRDFLINSDQEIKTYVGGTFQILYELGTSINPVYNTECTFSSSMPKIVSVDAHGNVKALKKGSSVITVTSKGKNNSDENVSKSFTVTVGDSVKFKKAKFNIKKASAYYHDLSVRGKYKAFPLSIEFDPGYTGDVTLKISDYYVAVCSENLSYEYTFKNVSGGKISTELFFKTAGKITVTASFNYDPEKGKYENKQISSTISINGVYDKRYLKDGNYVTGILGVDKSEKLVARGKSALKSSKVKDIFYADPYTGEFVEGIFSIDKKKYYFDNNMVRPANNKTFYYLAEETICINKNGVLQTGWINKDGKEYYFDPSTGYKAWPNTWVPRGKSLTYIFDADGAFGGIEPGHHTIGGKTYFFNSDLTVAKGLVYFDDSNKVVKASKATKVEYFDPATGAMVMDTSFKVGKNIYYASTGPIPVKSLYFGNDGEYHITDKNGASIAGKFITFEGNTYYADDLGCLERNCGTVINGKYCIFDEKGILEKGQNADENGYVSAPNLEATIDGSDYELFCKASDKKKPEKGMTFYYRSGEKYYILDSTWIYKKGSAIYHTDKNGVPLTGIQKIKDGSEERLYYFNENDSKLHKVAEIVKYKKKLYYCTSSGLIVTQNEPEFNNSFYKLSGGYIHIKNSSGELATGITSINGKKYIFDDNGILLSGFTVQYKGKIYIAGSISESPENGHIMIPSKGHSIFEGNYALNKDGSVKNGWVTEGKKTYFAYYGALARSYNTHMLYLIKGKLYAFSDDKSLYSGWLALDDPDVYDVENSNFSRAYTGSYYFYFDPKTKAAVTGVNKMKAPLLSDKDSIYTDESGVKPVIGESKKELCFNTDPEKLPFGALAVDTYIYIKGKTYKTAKDGSILSGKPGLTTVAVSDIIGENAYVKKDGTLAVGRTEITLSDGTKTYFYFDKYGRMERNVLRKTGKKWYFYGDNGQMSCSLEAEKETNHHQYITGQFNKDNSLKGFVEYVNGTPVAYKSGNVFIRTSALSYAYEYYYLKNGLPATGFINSKMPNDQYRYTRIIDGDGGLSLDKFVSIQKSGKKYYLVELGLIIDNTGKLYEVDDYSSLPSSVRQYIDQRSFTSKIYAAVNPDGSLSSGTVNISGDTYHKNKYGIIMDYYSDFCKCGKTWYVSSQKYSKTESQKTITVTDLTSKDEKQTTITIYWDKNLKLKSVKYKDTGKPVNGILTFDDHSTIYRFKNGLPCGGNQVFMYMDGLGDFMDFDNETGRAFWYR